MLQFIWISCKSFLKERIFGIIISLSTLYFFIPVFSSFSMRQVQEVGITMCLSLNSFVLLLLSVLCGLSTLWRDIERRYVYIMLAYPVSRTTYFLGRFLGCVILFVFISVINFFLSIISINICASIYKSNLPILWNNIGFCFLFTFLKYVLLLSLSFLFISLSTSFFTPFFLTITIYIAGNASQGIYEYIFTEAAQKYSVWFKILIKIIYYILPNFSSFDLTAYASYALKINYESLLFSFLYFMLYMTMSISLGCIIFSKRDML